MTDYPTNGYVYANDFDQDLHLVVDEARGPIEQDAPFVKCKACGGTLFELAMSEFTTFARCPTCKWEEAVHDG